LYNAHRISVCVIAVSKSHEFLLKVRRLSSFFDDDASTRRNFSATTQGIRLRRRVDVFFPRRRALVMHERCMFLFKKQNKNQSSLNSDFKSRLIV